MTEARAGSRDYAESLRRARAAYAAMVETLRSGERLPAAKIFLTIGLAEKTAENLVRDVLAIDAPGVQPGNPCPKCDGRLAVYSTRRLGDQVVQYLKCGACGARPRPNKRTLPGPAVPRRGRRANS